MSRSLGRALPPHLVTRLSQSDLAPRLGTALPLITVDGHGHPHPMLVSYLEVRAYDARTVGLVIAAASGSARNLVERRHATLMLVEPDLTAYVKLRTVDGPLEVAGSELLGYFLLEVVEVLEDAPADWEAGLRITEAIRFRPVLDRADPMARLTLAALAEPRARA